MPDQDVVFERKNKLYVAEWSIENMEVNAREYGSECYNT